MTPPTDIVRMQSRSARANVEAALDANGWRWNPGISRWLEVLVALEEGNGG